MKTCYHFPSYIWRGQTCELNGDVERISASFKFFLMYLICNSSRNTILFLKVLLSFSIVALISWHRGPNVGFCWLLMMSIPTMHSRNWGNNHSVGWETLSSLYKDVHLIEWPTLSQNSVDYLLYISSSSDWETPLAFEIEGIGANTEPISVIPHKSKYVFFFSNCIVTSKSLWRSIKSEL